MRTVMTNKNGKTFILSGCLSKLEIPPHPLKLSEPEGRDGVWSQQRVVKYFANHRTLKCILNSNAMNQVTKLLHHLGVIRLQLEQSVC